MGSSFWFYITENMYFEVKAKWSSGTLEWPEPCVAIDTVIGSKGDKPLPRGRLCAVQPIHSFKKNLKQNNGSVEEGGRM